MKKINLIQIVFTFALMGLCKNSFGQFAGASATENNVSISTYPLNTGNDKYDDANISYNVSVWSDGAQYPGIGWKVYDYSGTPTDYTGKSPFALTKNVYHADVCIIQSSGNVYAVAVWYVGGSGSAWICEIFWWDPTNHLFSSIGTGLIANGNFGTTINVDGDENGDFVIVYDDASNNVYAVAGNGNGLYDSGIQYPLSSYPSTPSQIFTTTASFPDVCIHADAIYPTKVHISLINTISTNLEVWDYSFSSIVNSAPSGSAPTNFIPVAPNYYFDNLRIACPASGNGGIDDWTVVLGDDDRASNYNIEGINDFQTSISGLQVYNNGSMTNAPCNITNISSSLVTINYFPVVTYDNQSTPNVWIGWTMDNSSNLSACSGIVQAIYPVVIKCDKLAAFPASSSYMQVPTVLATNDAVNLLSLASRFASDSLLLTYYNVSTSLTDIFTKCVQSSSATSMRTTNSISQIFAEGEINIVKVNADASITINLLDMNGNVILSEKGTSDKITAILKRKTENIPASVYLARIISDDGKFYLSKKVFLGK